MSQAEPPAQSTAQTPAAPKAPLGIIFLIVLMDLLGFGLIIPLLPIFAKEYSASPMQIGLLMSVYSACQFIAAPILGVLSDRHGRRGVLVFSQAGSVAGYLLLALVMQFHWSSAAMALGLFYLSRVIDGLSGGNISTAQAYISDVTTQENRAKGMGLLGAAFGIGFAFGPFVGGVAAASYLCLPGYLAAFFSAVAMLLTFFKLPESREHKPTDADVWLHPSRFRPILANRTLTQLLLISFISMLGFVQIESMGALFLGDIFNWRALGVGLYFGYLGLIIAIVQGGMIGRLVKKHGDWNLTILGPLGVALGMLNMVYMKSHPIVWLLLLGGAINSAGRSLQTPTLFALISKNSDRRQQGVVFGINQGLGRVLGPVIGGWIYTRSAGGPFLMATILSLLVCLWAAGLRRQGNPALTAPTPDTAG
jgi:DHA1 family tetracycline resistance protein-like MFS transporter